MKENKVHEYIRINNNNESAGLTHSPLVGHMGRLAPMAAEDRGHGLVPMVPQDRGHGDVEGGLVIALVGGLVSTRYVSPCGG